MVVAQLDTGLAADRPAGNATSSIRIDEDRRRLQVLSHRVDVPMVPLAAGHVVLQSELRPLRKVKAALRMAIS